ncbi:MAG: arsenite S-adenosylmethyltransferase, partial [Gemmatimonadaceae bacterium]|nr:arsenite S-adenosylmethyltransferase [Chitinophagaceae bacterium]
EGELPFKLKNAAEMYAGCVAGAIQKQEYLDIIKEAGFTDISIQKEKKILIPDEILLAHLSQEELGELKAKPVGIYSLTVFATKADKCCDPGAGCC